MTTWTRSLTAAALALGIGAAVAGLAAPASAAAEPSATIGAVTCVDEDGQLTVTVTAGSEVDSFWVGLDGDVQESPDGDATDVAPGASADIVIKGIEDGDYTVRVYDDFSEDAVATATRAVDCDPAPVGPYANTKGYVYDDCAGGAQVRATNRPIGGNTEDLQAVEFTLVYTQTGTFDDSTNSGDVTDEGDPTGDVDDEGDDAGDETGDTGEGTEDEEVAPRAAVYEPKTLDTFTLDATTPRYERTLTADELGGENAIGTLELRAEGELVTSAEVGTCIVSATAGSGSGPVPDALPNTGLSAVDAWLAALGLGLIALGLALVRVGRREA